MVGGGGGRTQDYIDSPSPILTMIGSFWTRSGTWELDLGLSKIKS